MSLCTSCGSSIPGDLALCGHHHNVHGDDWAPSNRIMCNFIHRGIVPPRLDKDKRDDDLYAPADVG